MCDRRLGFLISLILALGCGAADTGHPDDSGTAGVTIIIPAGYRLGGNASDVPPGVILTEATAGQLVLPQYGEFWFPSLLAPGTQYAVSTSGSVPPGIYCSVANAVGTMPMADVSNLWVECRSIAGGDGR